MSNNIGNYIRIYYIDNAEKAIFNANNRPSTSLGSLEGSRVESRDKSNADLRELTYQNHLRPLALDWRELALNTIK